MFKIQSLTNDTRQKQTLVLPDGSQITMALYFVPMQLGWFIPELSYGDFVVQGLRIVNTPDLLYQWRNRIPFGLACFSASQREPSLQGDFQTDASELFILTAAEVEAYRELISNGAG